MVIVKEFEFHMAHRLPLHKGKCRFLHGHTYKLIVYIDNEVNSEGMVIDFGDLKKEIERVVIDRLDHVTALWQSDQLIIPLRELGMKVEIFEQQPTAEVMIDVIWNWIIFDSTLVRLKKLELWETKTSGAIKEC
jgi:6-pyruvoyltetrahydropterin/6-carboxytetrahydropterin synthase